MILISLFAVRELGLEAMALDTTRTCVDEVVGVVVVAHGTRLRSVELCVFDFFELHHGFGFAVVAVGCVECGGWDWLDLSEWAGWCEV